MSRRFMLVLLSAVCVAGVGAAPARAVNRNRPDATPITDGTVNVVARSADRIYVGGSFSRILPRVGPFAIVSPVSGDVAGAPPEVSGGAGRVDCITGDGSGGFYIGGDFTHVAGVVRHDAAHILADGTLDPAWDPDVSDDVVGIARLGQTVYLGGTFHGSGAINGNVSRDYLAAVDATSGRATAWAPEPNEFVDSLTAARSTVYFSGTFTQVGGVARHWAAAADATTGTVTGWNPDPAQGILGMVASGSTVYLGGDFVTLGGTNAGSLAAVDATTGAIKWDNVVGGVVYSLALSGSTLYFGGEFSSTAGGFTRHNAAAVNSSTGVVQPWDPNVQLERVRAVAVAGSSVYLGGEFNGPQSLNGTTERNYLAAVDPVSGAVTGWNPDPTGIVEALAVSGGSLGVGGQFTSLGPGVPRHNLAAFSALDGTLLPWAPEPDLAVHAILPEGPLVYVGGFFRRIGGAARTALAAIETETGEATGFSAELGGVGGAEVDAMQLVGSTLYIGGGFSTVNGALVRNQAAAVDVTSGLATPFDPEVNERVTAILVEGSTVYLGGPGVTRVGGIAPSGTAREGVAAVTADTGAVLPWNAALDGSLYAIAGSGSNIYLGGFFSTAGGAPRNGLAAVDANTATATAWDPHLPELTAVKALALSGSTLYAGGTSSRVGLTALDTTTGARLDWSPMPTGGDVLSLATDGDGGVIAGGAFKSFEESPQATLASFSVPPRSVAAPTLGGAPEVGKTLVCGEGTWGGSMPQSHAFEWLRDGDSIVGASGARLDLTGADGGHQLRCRVTATNMAGSASATSDPVSVAVPAAGPGPVGGGLVKPVVSGLKVAPRSFRAAKHGASIVPKYYATVSYRVTEAAKVTFTVQRPIVGRRHGKSCVKPTPKLRKAKKCKRYVPVRGSIQRSRTGAGLDRFHFSGRLDGRTLKPGAYRLTAIADAGGLRSQPVISGFAIGPPRPRHRHGH